MRAVLPFVAAAIAGTCAYLWAPGPQEHQVASGAVAALIAGGVTSLLLFTKGDR